MTTATRTNPTKAVAHRPTSRRFAIDPYRIEDIAWTREEILRARGIDPSRHHRPRRAAARAGR